MKSYCTVIRKNNQFTDRRQLVAFFNSMPPDGRFRLSFEQFEERTTPLNDYYWVILSDYVLPGFTDAGWDEFKTKEDCHEFFKAKFQVQSTQLLNNAEMLQYLENIARFCAEYLGVVIPPPSQKAKYL